MRSLCLGAHRSHMREYMSEGRKRRLRGLRQRHKGGSCAACHTARPANAPFSKSRRRGDIAAASGGRSHFSSRYRVPVTGVNVKANFSLASDHSVSVNITCIWRYRQRRWIRGHNQTLGDPATIQVFEISDNLASCFGKSPWVSSLFNCMR